MSALTPAVGLRCTVCGGRSTVPGDVDPTGRRWKCPHHGDTDDEVGASFEETGVGIVGGHFDVTDRGVFRGEEYMLANELGFEQQAPEVVDDVMFEYLFRMELDGETSAEIADEYGVVPSTVRDGAMRARRRLGL